MRVLDLAVKAFSGAEMARREQLELTPEKGIAGNYQSKGKRQVTILFRGDWEAACHQVGAALPWTTRRANILVAGTGLPQSKGTLLEIGDCTLEITGETMPCGLMEAAQSGLRAALGQQWRGGVTARVITTGRIVVGDSVTIKHQQAAAAD